MAVFSNKHKISFSVTKLEHFMVFENGVVQCAKWLQLVVNMWEQFRKQPLAVYSKSNNGGNFGLQEYVRMLQFLMKIYFKSAKKNQNIFKGKQSFC